MAAVRHLEFSKVGNFNSRSNSEAHCASYAKFREDTLNRSGDMADFRFFKMAAATITLASRFYNSLYYCTSRDSSVPVLLQVRLVGVSSRFRYQWM